MRRTTIALVAVLAFGLVAAAVPATTSASVGVAADDHSQPEFIQDCAAEPPDDFDAPADGNGVIGFVDGYWYNQPLEIDVEGGLTEDELDRLSARTAARFEVMRCLPAEDGVPTVEIKSREEFAEQQNGTFENVSTALRQADNAKFETMLLIDSESNSTEVREENRGSTIGGTYNFKSNTITIVSDDPDSLLIDEEVLVHEIGHAVQDQQFNLTQYDRATTDKDKGILSLIEGDVTFIENRYLDACKNGQWEEPCITEEFGSNGDGGNQSNAPANWGLYFTQFQPYSDGPSLIQEAYDDGSWDAVNDLYEDPPRSAYYSAFPGSYGEVELTDIEVSNRSSDSWERLTFEDEPDHDTIGVAGISAMFATPIYESGGQFTIYEPRSFLNVNSSGGIDNFDPLNYNQPETEGWRDDKLYTYRNADNETGTVWTLDWASAEDAQPFVDSYKELIEFRNGQPVDGAENTYTFGEESEFDMAVTIIQDGDRVTIVSGPSVEDLPEIHDIELSGSENGDDSTDDGENGSEDGENGTDDSDATDGSDDSADGDSAGEDGEADDQMTETESDDSDGPGFGIVLAVVAVLGVALLASRR